MGGGVGGAYQGDAGQQYAERQIQAHAGLGEEMARRFQRYVRPTDTVVDFGCGDGGILEALDCQRRIGVEPNGHVGAVAQARGLEVVRNLGELGDASIDVLVSSHALEHCLNPLAEVTEMRRVLRPTGTVVLLLPVDDWRNELRPNPDDPDHHLYTWTPLLIGNLLIEAGFTVDSANILRYWEPPRGASWLWTHVPERVFDLVCILWSMARRRRQLLAIAHP
jgi:SAM-dependent methyltransferase